MTGNVFAISWHHPRSQHRQAPGALLAASGAATTLRPVPRRPGGSYVVVSSAILRDAILAARTSPAQTSPRGGSALHARWQPVRRVTQTNTFRNPEIASDDWTRIDRARRPRSYVYKDAGGLRELWIISYRHSAFRCSASTAGFLAPTQRQGHPQLPSVTGCSVVRRGPQPGAPGESSPGVRCMHPRTRLSCSETIPHVRGRWDLLVETA